MPQRGKNSNFEGEIAITNQKKIKLKCGKNMNCEQKKRLRTLTNLPVLCQRRGKGRKQATEGERIRGMSQEGGGLPHQTQKNSN